MLLPQVRLCQAVLLEEEAAGSAVPCRRCLLAGYRTAPSTCSDQAAVEAVGPQRTAAAAEAPEASEGAVQVAELAAVEAAVACSVEHLLA